MRQIHKFSRAAGIASFVLGLAACATQPAKVKYEYNSNVNLAAYKTFAVLSPSASGPVSDPGVVLRLTQPAKDAVREALMAKGLTEAPRQEADCVVRVRGQSIKSVEVSDWGYTAYPYGVRRPGWGYSSGFNPVNVRETTSRTLIVEIFDSASKNEAWVGWSNYSGSGTTDPDKLKAAIQNILARFPKEPDGG